MKTKNILGLVAIVAVAVAMAFNVTVSNKKTDTASLLALKNVEALAGVESGGDGYKSMLVTEDGSDYECINQHLYKVNRYVVNCFGTGTMACTSGNYETLTPTGTQCQYI